MLPVDIASYESMNTKNLVLRKATIRDVDDIFEIRNDPQLFRYLDDHMDKTKDETRSYLARMNKGQKEHKWIIWVIEYKADRKVIGTICLANINDIESSASVDFVMHPNYQNQGYMQESLDTVAMISFDKLGLEKLIAVTDSKNTAAVGLVENSDFRYVETIYQYNAIQQIETKLNKYILVNEYNFF
ncbi:GNAT family N-acetyltransferase [Desemzia sp. RIT804]|uniref:GNAT family N-acetyltransferase n=1 Tax=Desemzia sp. RIT 804 TaxID=2810209 RepID=UPI0019500046|nr:GNAT family N-acetyltransferase [Desemzia sp. RIT 804]MBM6614323.1 GNAT family N-acetyltransferase [Desemzia sp. RIT 804]